MVIQANGENLSRKKKFSFSLPDVPPRIYLFFFAVVIQLIASAFSGIGYSARGAAYWLVGMVLWVLWFALLFVIATPQMDAFLESRRAALKRWAKIIFLTVLSAGVVEIFLLVYFVPGYVSGGAQNDLAKALEQMQHGFQYNDGTALVHQAVNNLLDGKNPYAHGNIVEAFIEFEGSYDRVTPLREGRFAAVFPYPSQAQFKEVWDKAVQNPSRPPPEIESHVCYPAGSFLLPAPFIAAGINDMRVIYFIFVIGGLAYTVWRLPGEKRFFLVGLILISLELWNVVAIGETGVIVFPLLLIAWVSLGRNNLLSAVFMGLAVASKQTAWFFLPFYFLLLWRTSGQKPVGIALGVIAAIFVAANAYFIAVDPALWLKSVTSPMTVSMFPLGVGLISFVTSGLVDIRTPLPFTIMESIVFIGAVVWYWRNCLRYPDAGPVLAVLPMFFAWRSLWPYFFYVTIIVCAAMLIREDRGTPSLPSPVPQT